MEEPVSPQQETPTEHTPVAAPEAAVPQKSLLTKGDIISILAVGEVIALLAMVIRKNAKLPVPDGIVSMLPIIVPILALACLVATAWLGKKRPWFFQLGKYAAIGFLNTALDLGTINILMLWSGVTSGFQLGALNAISFTIAVVNSYFWNKYWTFKGTAKASVEGTEFLQFVVVSVIGLLLNSGYLALMTKYFHPEGFDAQQWANVVKLTSIFISLAWNFVGYKFIVFRTKKTA